MTMQATNADTPERQGAEAEHEDFVSMTVAGQWFGIPVLAVQDVLASQRITRNPLAPAEVAGSLNLRGRVVTAIDFRRRLGLGPAPDDTAGMSIVVEHEGELYSLLVDSVGEVLHLPTGSFERNPTTLDSLWRQVSDGIFRLDEELLIVVDIARLLTFANTLAE